MRAGDVSVALTVHRHLSRPIDILAATAADPKEGAISGILRPASCRTSCRAGACSRPAAAAVSRRRAAELKLLNSAARPSKGIDNARNRIALVNNLYGTDIRLIVEDLSSDGTGTSVRFNIPKTLRDVR